MSHRRSDPSAVGFPCLPAGIRLLAVLLFLAAFGLLGDAPPEPSSAALDEDPPVPSFEVRGFVVEGNTVLTREQLRSVLVPYLSEQATVESITRGMTDLQREYRERGFATVAVALPEQEIAEGMIRVLVIEGRLAEIEVRGNRHFSTANVLRALPGLEQGQVLNAQVFQAELDRANANPDRQIYPELGPGPEPGTSSLWLDVKDRFPLHGGIELNNHNTPGSPDLRLNANISYHNLWQREHTIGFQYGFSPEEYKTDLDVAGLGYKLLDAPLVAYYSAFYRLPLQSHGPVQSSMARSPESFGFDEVTREFVLPPTMGRPDLTVYASRSSSDILSLGPLETVTETALLRIQKQDASRSPSLDHVLGLRLSVPLGSASGLVSIFSAGLDLKESQVATYSSNIFHTSITVTNEAGQPITLRDRVAVPGLLATNSVVYLPWSLRWDGSINDRGGRTAFGFGTSFNFPISGLSSEKDFQRAVGSESADGAYVTVDGRISREQKVFGGWTVYAQLDGQLANQPLISNEQYGVGGTSGVRGYREGELYGDSGWRVILEPRAPPILLGSFSQGNRQWLTQLRLSAFMDYAQVYFSDRQGRDSPESLWGTGFSLNLDIGPMTRLRASFAWPLEDRADVRAGKLRANWSVSTSF